MPEPGSGVSRSPRQRSTEHQVRRDARRRERRSQLGLAGGHLRSRMCLRAQFGPCAVGSAGREPADETSGVVPVPRRSARSPSRPRIRRAREGRADRCIARGRTAAQAQCRPESKARPCRQTRERGRRPGTRPHRHSDNDGGRGGGVLAATRVTQRSVGAASQSRSVKGTTEARWPRRRSAAFGALRSLNGPLVYEAPRAPSAWCDATPGRFSLVQSCRSPPWLFARESLRRLV